MDPEASNYDSKARVNDRLCVYPPIVRDGSFETHYFMDWNSISSTCYTTSVVATDVQDGIMPTDGRYYLKCLPNCDGTSTSQTTDFPNKHFKGFYFDYRYIAKAGNDSIVSANASLAFWGCNKSKTTWIKTIFETPATFGGFPSIVVEKRNEYFELPYADSCAAANVLYIGSDVSRGTFTFEIDNIRLVPR